jgi:acetyltransferase-like isoleucine patch superfamily enzyme
VHIEGIHVANGQILIFMNDRSTFIMRKGQLINGSVNFMMHEPSKILIGNDCLWGSGELLTSDCHSIISKRTGARINPAKSIEIGDRVWFGSRFLVLKGAQVGSDSVISTGAIVTSGDYPPNSILAGSPARFVKSNIAWVQDLL